MLIIGETETFESGEFETGAACSRPNPTTDREISRFRSAEYEVQEGGERRIIAIFAFAT
jgi:hypothetical protein